MTRPIDTFGIRPSNAPPGYASDVNAYGDGQFVRNDDHKAEIGRLTERVRELEAALRDLVSLSENIIIDEVESDEEDLDAFYGKRCDARVALGDGVSIAKREGE